MSMTRLMSAQPWLKYSSSAPATLEQPPVSGGPSIIAAFNNYFDVHTLLQRNGYTQVGPGRYLSPYSSTGTPGIIVLPGDDGNERVFCHHASDPLASDHRHDAFSLLTILEHDGDSKAAAKAATKLLGITVDRSNRASSSGHKSTPIVAESVVEVPWDARLPLPALYAPVPTLPPELIPSPLRPWLVDIAERASLPLEFVTCPALVALSAVVGRKVGIRPKRLDDWLVVPNLWGGIVGKPGVMKSTAISEPLKPLMALAKRAHERYELAAEKAEAERVRLELEIAALKENEKRSAKGRYKSE